MNKKENQGFALLEVLIAVCIMAIIIIPLLHSFLSAYRVNAKSKEILRATTLAQNEMEIFEKETVKTLSTDSSFGYNLTEEKTKGIFVFDKKGIKNSLADSETFDVYITLDPLRKDPTQLYYAANHETITKLHTVSGLDSGTYIQPIATANSAAALDESVYNIFHMHKNLAGTGAGYSKADFEKILERTIKIIVTQTKEINPSTIVKVKYIYSCKDPDLMQANYDTYEKEWVIFDNSQVFNEAGEKVALENIYLFYAPRYMTNHPDQIEIYNSKQVSANFFIIRQDIQKRDGSEKQQMPIGYKPSITIYDDLTKEGVTNGKYFTNLNLWDSPAPGKGQQVQIRLVLNSSPYIYFSRDEGISKTGINVIGAGKEEDRLYSMNVSVYRHGADWRVEEPIVRLNGTKLD